MSKLNVLAINGSPRGKRSNTDRILQAFLRGMEEEGSITETIYAKNLNVHNCCGCYNCWLKTPGKCIFNDDMEEVLTKMKNSDVLIWATPIYHLGMTSILKKVMERNIPLMMPDIVKKGGRYVHPLRYNKNQKVVLISNCGFPERDHFQSLEDTIRKICEISGDEYAASILCSGGELLGEKALGKSLKWYIDTCTKAGKEFAVSGKISEETQEILKKEFVPREAFIGAVNSIFNPSFKSKVIGLFYKCILFFAILANRSKC